MANGIHSGQEDTGCFTTGSLRVSPSLDKADCFSHTASCPYAGNSSDLSAAAALLSPSTPRWHDNRRHRASGNCHGQDLALCSLHTVGPDKDKNDSFSRTTSCPSPDHVSVLSCTTASLDRSTPRRSCASLSPKRADRPRLESDRQSASISPAKSRAGPLESNRGRSARPWDRPGHPSRPESQYATPSPEVAEDEKSGRDGGGERSRPRQASSSVKPTSSGCPLGHSSLCKLSAEPAGADPPHGAADAPSDGQSVDAGMLPMEDALEYMSFRSLPVHSAVGADEATSLSPKCRQARSEPYLIFIHIWDSASPAAFEIDSTQPS